MEKVNLHKRMVVLMMVNSLMVIWKEKAPIYGVTVKNMLDLGVGILEKVLVL